MEQVRNFRSLGYGVGFDFLRAGMSTIAWALRPRLSSRAIVVSVVGPTDRIRPESKAVIQAARAAIRRYTGT
jgi:DNA-binding IclR family transcriptional regulator